MLKFPLQPNPHIQVPAQLYFDNNNNIQSEIKEIDVFPSGENLSILDEDIDDGGEIVHVIDKTASTWSTLGVSGTLLSLMVWGSLSNMENYAGCLPDTRRRDNVYWAVDDATLDIVCLASSNKILTVALTVWTPIIIFCVSKYFKTDYLKKAKHPVDFNFLDNIEDLDDDFEYIEDFSSLLF